MGEPGQLSVNDRVLLHLSRFATDIPPEEHPPEITQAGIAGAVGISRTHVPRAVKGLMRDNLVQEVRGRVQGHERRMSVYVVTIEGLRRAESVWGELQGTDFSVLTDGRAVTMKGKDIEAALGKKRAIAAVSQMRDGVVELGRKRRPAVRDLAEAPGGVRFLGRDAELKTLDEFMESDTKIMVIMGTKGCGTSALARKFVDEQDEADVLWVGLGPNADPEKLQERLVSFARKVSAEAGGLFEALNLPNALVVFDDYGDFGEDMVEFFSSLLGGMGDTKIIVTAREDTPVYSWFYQRKDVESGAVGVLRVKGLDEESARKLLGNDDIEADAFRRIFMMTRGQPLVLRMLRDGDSKGMKSETLFTAEEIRYLLFLKDKKG